MGSVLCFPPGFSVLPGPMASPTSETYGHVGWLGGHGSLSSMPQRPPNWGQPLPGLGFLLHSTIPLPLPPVTELFPSFSPASRVAQGPKSGIVLMCAPLATKTTWFSRAHGRGWRGWSCGHSLQPVAGGTQDLFLSTCQHLNWGTSKQASPV